MGSNNDIVYRKSEFRYADQNQLTLSLTQLLRQVTHPTVSILGDIMMTPARLVRPTVGLIPTTELKLDGHIIVPSVSVPMVTATKYAATAIADPLLEAHGVAVGTYGFCISNRNQSAVPSQHCLWCSHEMN
jgi:hypothetical protein